MCCVQPQWHSASQQLCVGRQFRSGLEWHYRYERIIVGSAISTNWFAFEYDCFRALYFLAGECRSSLQGHANAVFAVAWSADDKLASAAGDKSVRIWDGFTGEALGVLKGHTDRVICLAWSSKGRLASGSADASARVWPVINVFFSQ
jgi:WD40 repeat protein